METIRIENEKLLKIIKKNRNEFKELYEGGIKIYTDSIENKLLETLKKIEGGNEFDISLITKIQKPINYIKEYNMVIRMLELTIDEIVELDSYEFAKYVQNDWNWKQSFKSILFSYSGSTMGSSGSSGGSGTPGLTGSFDYDNYYQKLDNF